MAQVPQIALSALKEQLAIIVLFTDAIDVTIEEALAQCRVGQHGWRCKAAIANELTHIYLANATKVPGISERPVHIRAMATIKDLEIGEGGVVFVIEEEYEPLDLEVVIRFGDARNGFRYVSHEDLTLSSNERAKVTKEQEKAIERLLGRKNLDAAIKFVIAFRDAHFPGLKIPNGSTVGERFQFLLRQYNDPTQAAKEVLGV